MLSGFLVGITSLGHAILGEKDIISDVQTSKLNDDQKLCIRVCWHIVTTDFVVSSIVLLFVGLINVNESIELLVFIIGLHFLLYGILFFLLCLIKGTKHVFRNPQWLLLLGISVLSFIGLYS